MRKTIEVEGLDEPVVLSRRKGTRNLKISINSGGVVRVSIPYGVPERVAERFVKAKIDWILEHRKAPQQLAHGMHIGKSHTLLVEHADISRPSTKVSAVEVRVRLPHDVDIDSSKAQTTIRAACNKALLQESKNLLPQRMQHLSEKYDVPYQSVTIKKLKSRWGACDERDNITLSSYLIQLDWRLIDYVICHELAHTIHHDHSSRFWAEVERMQPDYKDLRKELKDKPTDVITT